MNLFKRYIIEEREEYYDNEDNIFACREIKKRLHWWNIIKDLLGILASIAAIYSVIVFS